MNDTTLQRAYYARTASLYDEAHLSAAEPEHDFALDFLSGIARAAGYRSFLDVGSGTGRGIARLQREFPQAEIVGVEPVAELREVVIGKVLRRPAWLMEMLQALIFQMSHSIAFLLSG